MEPSLSLVTTPIRKRESHLWARDPHDFYVEPEWVSERLFHVCHFESNVYDPACGTGRIVKSARKHGLNAFGTDLVDRGCGIGGVDFLKSNEVQADNIVSNPPFGIADRFVIHALHIAKRKVAMLLPATWLLGDKRSRWLERSPLARVLFITPRPSMPPGAVILAGEDPGGGTKDFAWLIWSHGRVGPPDIGWLRRDA